MGLGDVALVKDNHVAAAGSVVNAFRAVRAAAPDLPCEMEVDSLEQLSSSGLSLENAHEYAATGLDDLAVGALIQRWASSMSAWISERAKPDAAPT